LHPLLTSSPPPITGSIFFWYGLITFSRYLGAFSSLGWAWNRHPSSNSSIWTAEFTECLVIFTYGSTNMWLERLGKTGAWSIKDVQHTSIAILVRLSPFLSSPFSSSLHPVSNPSFDID
jgi:hypothetical protein